MPAESKSIASYSAIRNPSDKVEQTQGEFNSLFKKQDVTAAEIVANFTCGKIKCGCLVTHGIHSCIY